MGLAAANCSQKMPMIGAVPLYVEQSLFRLCSTYRGTAPIIGIFWLQLAAARQNYKAKFAIALLPLKIQKIRKLILTDNAPQKEILEIVSKKVTKFKRFFPKNSLNSNNSVSLRRSPC